MTDRPANEAIDRAAEAGRDPPFWIVRRMQPRKGGIPQTGRFFRHSTKEAAVAQAELLAGQYPGRQYVVLEAIASFQIDQPAPIEAPIAERKKA